jgi:hypothetical protein
MADRKKLDLIICAHDGITSLYAGVGTAVNGYFRAVENIVKELGSDYDVKVWGIAPKYAESNYGFNGNQLKKITDICRKTGGDVLFCFNYSDGWNQYGNMDNWPTASASAATIAYEILKADKPTDAIVIGVDTPFAMTPAILNKQMDLSLNYHGIWMPHSTSLIHERGGYDTERLKFEIKAVRLANENSNLFTGYLNPYMKKHMAFDYGASEESLTPILNGIVVDEVKEYSQEEIEAAAKEKGVPLDKPIVFSYGRGVPYKGFDIFMKVAKRLEDLPYHFVVQAAPYTMQDPVVEQLNSLQNKNITLMLGLDFVFPRQLMQWNKTEMVAVLSKYEPGAFIPAEIRIYGKPIALVSDVDGLPCQVNNGIDGFITGLEEDQVEKSMRHILSLNQTERDEVKKKGRELVINDYNMVTNFTKAIQRILNYDRN